MILRYVNKKNFDDNLNFREILELMHAMSRLTIELYSFVYRSMA